MSGCVATPFSPGRASPPTARYGARVPLAAFRFTWLALAGQGKTRGTVAMNSVELCTNQSIAAILPSPSFVPEYLYYNLDARYDELRALSTGEGGRGGLNLKIIKSIALPFPKTEEQ